MPQYNLADELASIRRQRNVQMQAMLAKQSQVAQPGPMGAPPQAGVRPSLIGGLVKKAAGDAGLSSLSKNFGNPTTAGTAPSVPQGTPTGGGPNQQKGGGGGGGGFGGFLKDWGQGFMGNLGIQNPLPTSGAVPAAGAVSPLLPQAAGMTFSAAAPAASTAIPMALSSAGAVGAPAAASGAAAGSSGVLGAIGQGISSAISAIAALFSTERMKHGITDHCRRGDLRWVRYRYLPEFDPAQIERVGLIAEEVATTHPEWIERGLDGRPLAIYYGRIPEHLWP